VMYAYMVCVYNMLRFVLYILEYKKNITP